MFLVMGSSRTRSSKLASRTPVLFSSTRLELEILQLELDVELGEFLISVNMQNKNYITELKTHAAHIIIPSAKLLFFWTIFPARRQCYGLGLY